MKQLSLKFDHFEKVPTSEQMDIYNIDFSKHSVIVIRALAGTGKTSTILDDARLHPEKKFLYISLNVSNVVSVKEDAEKLNITNIKFYTIHAYANELTQEYSAGRPKQEITLDFIKDYLFLPNHREAFFIKKMLILYCQQAMDFSTFSSFVLTSDFKILEGTVFSHSEKTAIINHVETLLNGFNDKTINFITHDLYLKYFIDNQKLIDYDCLLIDESQDLNDAMFSFVESQINFGIKNVIAVGDQNQSIYGFLKSKDIMKKLEEEYGAIVKTLTRSFRFHPNSEMELYANRFLSIRGMEIYGAAIHKDAICRNEAYIGRTNMQVLEQALKLIIEGRTFHLMGGTKSIDVELIMDIWNLCIQNHSAIKSGVIKEYENISDFKEWAVEKNLVEFTSGCNFISQVFKWQKEQGIISVMKEIGIYEQKIPFPKKILLMIKAYDKKKSETILSTFHKSKGLGLDRIIILPSQKQGKKDFMVIPYGTKIIKNPDIPRKEPLLNHIFSDNSGETGYLISLDDQKEALFDEYNLMYVAVTRAKKEMHVLDERVVASANFISALYSSFCDENIVNIKVGRGQTISCYKTKILLAANNYQTLYMEKNNALLFLAYIKERRN